MSANQPPPRDLIGHYEIYEPGLDRQLAMDAFAAIRDGHPMVALLELDVTKAIEAIETLRQAGRRVSLFAFVTRCIAVALSEHRDLNLVRHGRKLVRFEDVDVSVPVEVATPGGFAPREVVLRQADRATPEELYAQLETAKQQHQSAGAMGAEDRWARRLAAAIRWLPRFVRVGLIRLIMRNGFRIKQRAGTTLVTSVGKFAAIPGHAFTFSTGPRAAVFVVGSVVRKPWIHDDRVVPRSILDVSIIVDHDLVDGGPAARYARRLQELVESANGLAGPEAE